jgi:hypothetical protein
VRLCTSYALEHCADDLHYFEHEYPNGEKGLQERLKNVAESEFAKIITKRRQGWIGEIRSLSSMGV